MKKHSFSLFLIVTIIVFPFILFGQTHNFSGHISNDTTWANTVLVDGDVYVDNGWSLNIEPGTTIEFLGYYKIKINGSLQAIGTVADTIAFTIADTTGFSNYYSTNGAWNGLRFWDVQSGNDSSIFRFCKIQYSKAVDNDNSAGGAISYYPNQESKFKIANCLIQNCIAKNQGGAIWITSGSLVNIIDNVIRNNRSLDFDGGGICMEDGTSLIIRNNIINNNSANFGAGISVVNDNNSLIVNNLLNDNLAITDGGGIHIEFYCSTQLINNTICNNDSYGESGGINFNNHSNATLKSNIIWGNTSPQCVINSGSPNFYNCDIQGGFAGIAGDAAGGNFSGVYQDNIDNDPLFLNQTPYPYNLSIIGSPCVDAGFPDTTGLHLPKHDLAGNTRVYSNWENSLIDIGAYEFQKNPKKVSITPEDGSTINDVIADLSIGFDSQIAKQNGNIIIYNEDGSVFEIIPAANSTINSNTATIPHLTPFINNYNYYVNIENTAFDDGYGNYFSGILDDSTWNFSVITPDSFAGNALDFDGINDYVEIADDNSLDLTNNYTIEVWIKPTQFNALDGIVSKYQTPNADGYYLRLLPDSPYTGLNFDGMKTANGILEANKWYHIAAVNNNGTRNLYLNGELQSLSGTANTVQSNSDNFCIGVDYLTQARHFHGKIDEVRLWNVARTESEIRENMNLTSTGMEPGLISYWQFNDSTGTFAEETVSGNNGTLKNMHDDDWTRSNIAVGNGTSITQTVSTTGVVDFQGTGISINFTQKTGSDTIVVTRLKSLPNTEPEQYDDLFNSQYWIFRKYGTGTFESNIAFTTIDELYPNDENNPKLIDLYKRNSNSESDWIFFNHADSVNASLNFALYNDINDFSQFMLTRYQDLSPPDIVDSYPKDNSYNPLIDSIQIIFKEAVDEVNGKSIYIYNTDGTLWNTYTIPSTQITGSGSKSITINFGSILGDGQYYVQIDSDAFVDKSNNSYIGINNQTDWNFVVSGTGNITTDTVWSEYTYINRSLWQYNNYTLTILPGTRVEFLGDYLLDIQGRLLALGTVEDSILFTTPSSSHHWDRLHFDNTPASNDTSKISYCIFEYGHTSGDGGAIYINYVDKLIINRSTIRHNYAYTDGGGIYIGHCDPIIQNNLFHDNQTQLTGGGITLDHSNPVITGNVFRNNKTWNNGGAVYFLYSSPHFINNTIVYNFSTNWGGGLDFENSSNAVVENTIIYHNTRYQGEASNINIFNSDPNFYYCDIGNGFNSDSWNGQNLYSINKDPLFTGNKIHPYSLQKISPCIDLGNPGTTTDTIGELDIAGNERIRSGRVDIGAYEQGRISDGFAGTAIEFAGTGGYINLPDNGGFDFSSSFTIEAWVNFGLMTEGEHTIIKNGEAWEIKALTVPDLVIIKFGINNNDLFVSFQTDHLTIDNEWNHISCVYNSENSTMTIYLNGVQGGTDFALPLASTCDSITFGGDYIGKIDEFRIWDTTRTISEIRENMHLTLSDLDPSLTTFLQFNEGVGTRVLDLATGYEGSLVNMSTSDCWVTSTMPAGDGASNSQIVYATGNRDFAGTNITMDFTEKMWSDTIVVTRIGNAPNLNPYGADDVFNNQYWIVDKFGTGTFMANITFTIDDNFIGEDEINPEQIRLYNRSSNSHTKWNTLGLATFVNTTLNSATIDNISSFSQFILARKAVPDNFAGKTLEFDGVDEEVNLGNNESLNFTDEITVEIWLKTEDTGHNARILHKGTNKFLDWDSSFETISGKGIRLNIPGLNTGWWEFQYDMNYGQWYHVAWTLEANGLLTAYINGEIVRQEIFSGNILSNNNDLLLANPDGSSHWYKGSMDEFRLWNVARTSQEIKENMYLSFSGTEQGLVSYWQFNEGSEKHLTDRAGGNNGKLKNIASNAWTESSIPFGSGVSNTQIVSSTGKIEFSGTDITIDFTNKTGTDTIVVTRIDTVPNINPSDLNTVFNKQYWAINKFGTGTLNSDISFVLQNELTQDDEAHPERIKLYTRGGSTDTNWVYLTSANSINLSENKVVFEDISVLGQFIIGRKIVPGNYPGNALSFDGIDDYVSIAPTPTLDINQFTIEFWTRAENPSNEKGIIDKGMDSNSDWYFLSGYPGETRGVIFGAGNGSSTIELMNSWNDNSWHYVAGTYDGIRMNLYVDGVITGSALISIDITSNNITFGSNRNRTSFFNGKLDEVRIWDTALTEQEIRENMHLTSYESEPGLVSYWQFNEESGTIAFDYNKTNNGTMVNMDDTPRILSTVATGSGFSNTQTETNGTVNFPGTKLSMDFNSQQGASITVTRIDTAANLNPADVELVFSSQYWVVNRFSNSTINTDITFTVNENLTDYDAANPGNIKLYSRESNSDESWTLLKSASLIDASANTATFEGITGFGQFIIVHEDRIKLDLTVVLEGPYNGTDMDTYLNGNPELVEGLPLTQPYNIAPWNYSGTESVDTIPDDVVDWVLIELRDTTGASYATGKTAIARRAAFILNDGKIIDTAGTDTRLCVSAAITNNLFVVIWHRNHLGIMSANPVTKSDGIYTYDFTTGNTQAYGTNAQKDLGSGVYGMISADANADGIINVTDKTIWKNQAGEQGYKSADFDLNGQVNNPDKNDKWTPNENEVGQVPE